MRDQISLCYWFERLDYSGKSSVEIINFLTYHHLLGSEYFPPDPHIYNIHSVYLAVH